jgi:hypothetical protein
LGVSCAGQKGVSQGKGDDNQRFPRELQLVLANNYSGVEQPQFQVVRDPKALKNFFLQINKTRKPGFPVPEVDFSKELLLVYCAGTTLGVEIPELVLVEDSKDKITVGLKERSISSKENVNVTTTPFSLYKMPLTPKEITFQQLE